MEEKENELKNTESPIEKDMEKKDDSDVISPSKIEKNDDVVNYVSTEIPISPKTKKAFPKGIIIALVVVVLGVLGYFVIYPFIVGKLMSKPENVYKSSIDSFTEKINSVVKENTIKEKDLYNLKLSIDSNFFDNMGEDFDLSGIFDAQYEFNFGIDPKSKKMQAGFNIAENNDDYGIDLFIRDGKLYTDFSTNEDLLLFPTIEGFDLDELNKAFDYYQSSNLSNKDIIYMINNISNSLKASLDEKKLSKDSSTIKINKDELKVNKNTYTFDKECFEETIKTIIKGIENDEKFVDILTKLTNVEVEEVKENLDDMMSDLDIDDDFEIIFNIYTSGMKNDVVGFDLINDNEDTVIKYYFKDGNFNFNLDIEEIKIEAIGKKDGSKTNIDVNIDGEKFGSVVISKFDESGIELTYSINNVIPITGELKYSSSTKDTTMNDILEFKIDYVGTYVALKIEATDDWGSEIADINTATAKELSEDEFGEIVNQWGKEFAKTSIGSIIDSFTSTLSGDSTEGIEDYEPDDWDADSYWKEEYGSFGAFLNPKTNNEI